jgi:hypothetical protein
VKTLQLIKNVNYVCKKFYNIGLCSKRSTLFVFELKKFIKLTPEPEAATGRHPHPPSAHVIELFFISNEARAK